MKILVIGSGGREHALVWKISKSKKVEKIYAAPGNPGISQLAQNVPIRVSDLEKLIRFVKKEKIDLTIVGPEAPLIDGIVDLFKKNNLAIVGPTKVAAQIEGSKVFAKKLMTKYKIPTARFEVFRDCNKAKKYLGTQRYPLVIKADGPALGKGVAVVSNKKEGENFLTMLMKNKIFGKSANKIVIEECLEGQEISFILASDGENFVSFIPSQDHKRVYDGDLGSNTGGMGAYAPVPFVDKDMMKRIEKEIVKPVINAMSKEDAIYEGFLYPGLILTKDGPKVLEFNCRLGDPETQPLMLMLKSDIIDLFEAIINKRLRNYKLKWYSGSALCVVLTAKGYPAEYEKGKLIYGLSKPFARGTLANTVITFHSGTKISNGKLVTSGGRVLGVTAKGNNLKEAIKKAYKCIGKGGVYFSGMHYRKDIGQKALKYL